MQCIRHIRILRFFMRNDSKAVLKHRFKKSTKTDEWLYKKTVFIIGYEIYGRFF